MLGLLLAITIIIKILNPSPEKKAENLTQQFFEEFVFEGNATKAYELTNASFKSTTNLETFSADSTRLHKFYTQKFKRTGVKTYNGSLVVIYSAAGSDGNYIAEAGTIEDKSGIKIQYYNIARKF